MLRPEAAGMTARNEGAAEIIRAAYEIAWREFNSHRDLTPDERLTGPTQLRRYIAIITESGMRDPIKIAQSALGMIRDYEQIAQSTVRVTIRQAD